MDSSSTSSQDTEKVQQAIQQYKHESIWELTSKSFSDNDIKLICEELKTNTKCKELYVGHNHFLQEGGRYLAEMLKFNKTLTKLEVCRNKIGDDGVQAICRVLQHENSTLVYLNIGDINYSFVSNELTKATVDSIISMIEKNKTLELLHLGQNEISKENQELIQQVAEKREPSLGVYFCTFPYPRGVTINASNWRDY